jgi:Alpha-L-fucosidase
MPTEMALMLEVRTPVASGTVGVIILKFGIRVHWGLYCMIGSDASQALAGANREFWNIYNVLYQFFNPTEFDAEAWMNLFARIRFFTFTTNSTTGLACVGAGHAEIYQIVAEPCSFA